MKSPDRLDSRKLEKYTAASLVTDLAFEKRGRSQVQKAVDRACSAEANVVLDVAGNGSLDDKIALECRLQQRDLDKYAKSPNDAKNIRQGLKDMNAGLAAYACLTGSPGEYRRHAASYTDRNRDAKLDVPKDGMRYALASQTTRLQNRLSLQLSEEEKVLLTARRALLDSIHREYSALQQNTVHGRTMEPQKD